ncbi:hypothetical protein GLYMA_02G312100v4 [Glycine max]|uniref:Uncharacterized protein n=2 Tax=Glycine subgen. Soja TaxID=1462606 RepID=A0A0R0L493_SOYBN|nr:hypothetical protein JHK85_006074 [Glycine max]KRH74110.1 hypothetical protein GLYMA_02G312100v4 [Glycine max]RZC27625.1 hypothetical protein D0Y65_005622 [Glycine soja]
MVINSHFVSLAEMLNGIVRENIHPLFGFFCLPLYWDGDMRLSQFITFVVFVVVKFITACVLFDIALCHMDKAFTKFWTN